MKKILQLSTILTLSLVLSAMVATAGKAAPSALTVSTDLGDPPCVEDVDGFHCPSVATLFINGTGYPHSVHVLVTDVNNSGALVYEGDQIAPQGDLSIPQGLGTLGLYQVTVSYGKGKNTNSEVVLISVE